MRYTLQRYDNVFGNTAVTMAVNDDYFNRIETQYAGHDFGSLDDALSAVTDFLGSDDYLNLLGLRYIPITGVPYYEIAADIASRLHMEPYYGLSGYDSEPHNITDIIKINDKTTVYNDFGAAFVSHLPSYGNGSYAGAGTSYGGFDPGPWSYRTEVGGNDLSPNKRGYINLSFYAYPSSIIQNNVITTAADTEVANISINIYANINILGFISGYDASVFITYTTMGRRASDILTDTEADPQDDPNNDPYAGNAATGGQSGTGGGHFTPIPPATGTYDPGSDPNPVPGLPTISAADTGFITLFNPTPAQLKNLAQYMWGSLFDVTTWKKIFADPMDCILGLSIVPVNVPSGGTDTVQVGNISTGITMNKASSQFVEVDCGSISIGEKWKAYLDYSPYTKLSIFLPYIGAHDLNIDDIQINTIGVKYHIDILSGACVAFITAGGNVIAQYSGQCSISIPVTSNDFTQTIIALGTLVAGGAATVATGGLSAPVTASSIGGAATAMATTAANVITSKPNIQKSGNMSGSNGLMGVQTPYLFITRPKQCAPKNQNRYVGYPSYITEKLANISGFTQLQDVRLSGISCTESEMNEILNLLHEGVIL